MSILNHSKTATFVSSFCAKNPVIQSAEHVAANSVFVKINEDRMLSACRELDIQNLQPWLKYAPVDLSVLDSYARLHFVLLMSSLSFRYWGEPKWTVEYNGKDYDGAWGLLVALWKAIREGLLTLDPESWSAFDEQRARRILAGNVLIPRFEDRLIILRQLGHVLASKYKASFDCFLDTSRGDAVQLVLLVADAFPSFRDVATFDGQSVFFYKRAQLLVADVVRTCPETVPNPVRDISLLSACADYKLPWLLRKLGVLIYADSLAERVDAGIEIPSNSREEIEIRANTVWAVELMVRVLRERAPNITAIQLNDHLWLESQEKNPEDPHYHRTDTIFY